MAGNEKDDGSIEIIDMRKSIIVIISFIVLGFVLFTANSNISANISEEHNITQGKNTLAKLFKNANKTYVILRDYDLNGDTLSMPEGCVLNFKGGKIQGGTIILNGTYLKGKKGFHNIVLLGSCSNKVLSSDLFNLDRTGVIDNSVDVQSMFNIGVDSIVFSKGTYSFSNIHVENVSINASGSTFVSTLVSDNFSVINNIFVANTTDHFKLYNAIIKGRLEGSPRIQHLVLSPLDLTDVCEVEIKDCTFKELRYSCYSAYDGGLYDYRGVSLSCHGCRNVLVEGCEFYDIMPSEWIWIAPKAGGAWNDVENVYIRNNYFHNPKDDFERSNTPVNVFSNNVVFEGNLLEYQKYAGSAFNLQSRNVIVYNNVVRNSWFKSIVDVCEYGDFYNDYVAVYNNDFSAYNSQAVVANAKELIVKDNKFEGISAVLAYATYYNPELKHAVCDDYATKKATPNQVVLIEGNECNCDYVDMDWLSDGELVQGGYCSGFTVQSIFCVSDSVKILNNRLYIRDINSKDLDKRNHQPIYIRNAKNITVSGNYIDSDVPAVDSKYKGAVYILVYNRNRGSDAKLKEVESLNICDNQYNISSADNIVYTTRISGYSNNILDWRINNATISGNNIPGTSKKEQIYATGGSIEKLNIKGGKLDVKNSPAKIKTVLER